MAITINNNTILAKYTSNGNLFGAIKADDELLNQEIPATLDVFWPEIAMGQTAFIEGKIKTVQQCALQVPKKDGSYLFFGLRDSQGNRNRPMTPGEFVAFYNFFSDKAPILTRAQFDALDDVESIF